MTKGTNGNNVLSGHHLSVAPAISQAIADVHHTLDPALASAALLHGSFNPGASLLAGHAPGGSGDPSKGNNTSSSPTYNSPADALRNSTRLDPAHNPTSDSGDMKDDGIRPGKASFQDLAKQLGHAVTDPTQQSSNSSSGHHPENPGAPDGNRGDHHDSGHDWLANGLEHTTGNTMVDRGFDDKGDHHFTSVTSSDQGIVVMTDYILVSKSDGATTYAKGDWTTVVDANNHTRTTVNNDGSTITTDTETGKVIEHTDPISMPDPDHQSTLAPGWDDLLWRDVKQMHQANHNGDTVNVVDEIPGMIDQSAVAGRLVDEKTRMLGGDHPLEGLQEGGGSGPGHTNYNGSAGVTDPGQDSDPVVQTSGLEERGHETFKHETPGASADAPHGHDANGTGASATPTTQVESPALAAAHELADALAAGSDRDPWGTRGRYADAMAAPESRTETAGEKAADQLADAVSHHDAPSQDHPIAPHEGIPAGIHIPDLHGAGDVFADLIRAAHDPAQSGLLAIAQPAASDVHPALHLTLEASDAQHDLSASDLHVASASTQIAVHDLHVDLDADWHHL